MPLRVHAHVSYYDDQQYHFRKPQFSTAQRVCDPANHAAALCATFRNTTTKPTVIKDPSACNATGHKRTNAAAAGGASGSARRRNPPQDVP